VHKYAENAKISVRNLRHEEHSRLKKEKEASEISEDDFYAEEKELQQEIDEVNKQIDELAKKKESEVMTV
jgi:ribosome recycling factor